MNHIKVAPNSVYVICYGESLLLVLLLFLFLPGAARAV